jgi:parvulin-like peptidyl-prolyl isomerase
MRAWTIGLLRTTAVMCILVPGAARAQNDVVATVNGDSISAAEFYERVQRVNVRDFVISMNPISLRTQTAGQLLLDQMINERLTLQWAGKTNQMPNDAEIAAELERAKAQPQVQQALAAHLVTDDFLKSSIRYQKARFNLATTAASVSPQDVEKYYKDHLAAYSVPERYTLEGFVTVKQPDVAKIQADLKAGKPFADVVKTYCEDANIKARNGAMGTFIATDPSIPAPIREAAAALKEGQVSAPIKLEADQTSSKVKVPVWWFIKMAHREPAAAQPFAVVKAQVEQAALLERAGGIQVADKKIADFRQLSEIKINLPGYEMLLPKPKK